MGSSFFLSRAILPASTSAQTTSLPVSARHAPTTRPTYPVPTTPTFTRSGLSGQDVPGVDHQPGRLRHEGVVDLGVVGHDDDTIRLAQGIGGERHRLELEGVFLQGR